MAKKKMKLIVIATFFNVDNAENLGTEKLRAAIYLETENSDPLKYIHKKELTEDFIRHCEARKLKRRDIIRMLWPLGIDTEALCLKKRNPPTIS